MESPLGDSRLVTHYRLEFENGGQPKLQSVPFGEVRRCLFAKERIPYQDETIPPRITSSRQRMKHTIMVVLPRSDWALLFIKWTKDIMEENREKPPFSGGRVVKQLGLLG